MNLCPECGEPVEQAFWHPYCCPHDEVREFDERDDYMGRLYWWCLGCDAEVMFTDEWGDWELAP